MKLDKLDLNDNLQMKQHLHIKIFLISKKRFDKYMQEVFNTNNTNNNLIKNNNNYDLNNNILKDELFNGKNIYSLPEIFPLNRSCWFSISENYHYQQYILEVNFYNKLLLFDLKKYIKSVIIYRLFFLDDKNQLRQGYLQINDKTKEIIMINTFKENEPLHILKSNNIYINNEQIFYHSDALDYDLFIFEYDNEKYKDIDIKNIQNNNLNYRDKLKNNTKNINDKGVKLKGLENNDSNNQIQITNQKNQITTTEPNNFFMKKKKDLNYNKKNHLENKIPNNINKKDNIKIIKNNIINKFKPTLEIIKNKRSYSAKIEKKILILI